MTQILHSHEYLNAHVRFLLSHTSAFSDFTYAFSTLRTIPRENRIGKAWRGMESVLYLFFLVIKYTASGMDLGGRIGIAWTEWADSMGLSVTHIWTFNGSDS